MRPIASPAELSRRLAGAGRVAVLGVGSDLRGDDIAGCQVARRIGARLARIDLRPGLTVAVFHGGTAPENCTGAIKRFQPTHLVIVDAAHLERETGAVALIDPAHAPGVSISTHRLPMHVLLDYLGAFLTFETIVIGIQPGDLTYHRPPSPAVARAGAAVVSALVAAFVAHDRRQRP